MARYIDADALLEALKSRRLIFEESTSVEEAIAEQVSVFEEVIEEAPTADVVPKSEVDNWYHLYHSIKEELKQEKMYHRETENLCDRYCIESQQAKKQVAREIYVEIEKIIRSHEITVGLTFDDYEGAATAIARISKKIAEFMMEYTEGEK
jgi:hypothetical protein